ncbi:hypothetical protein FNF27_05524 [Cafeteria roenbergensis]|nr:hypothetical protein FNF27_05524 [Cafeteria roenbergensis]
MRKWHADRMERSEDTTGVPVMSPTAITAACLRHDGYESPELNETLYLHFRGFLRIQNLEPYTELRALFLESNSLQRIEGLSHLTSLRALFLQQNAISRIEGLSGLASLATLNLSQNAIERIDAGSLAALPSLTTLNLSRNRIQSADDIAALSECPSVTNLDLSHNDVDDEAVVPLLATLPALACLTLTGNPFLRTMRQFRKTTLAAMPRLAHLDDRPVFEEERVAVAAWKAGGSAAERTARKDYKEELQRRDKAQMEAYREWVARKRLERKAALSDLNAERAARGEAPLDALPPKMRVRYTTTSADGRDEVGDSGVPIRGAGPGAAAAAASSAAAASPAVSAAAVDEPDEEEVAGGGVIRDRSDRRIGRVPGAAEGITAEAAAWRDRIEGGMAEAEGPASSDAGRRTGQEAAASDGPATAAVSAPVAVAPPQPRAEDARDTTGDSVPPCASQGAPSEPAPSVAAAAHGADAGGEDVAAGDADAASAGQQQKDEGEDEGEGEGGSHGDAGGVALGERVTLSDEQNAVYESLRLYARRRGEAVPDSTAGAGGMSRRGAVFGEGASVGGESLTADGGASLASDATIGTSASGVRGGSGAGADPARPGPDGGSTAATVAGSLAASDGGPAGAAVGGEAGIWSAKLDAAVRRLVPAAQFDWRRAASAIQKAVRTGRLPPPPGPTAAGVSLTRAASAFSPEAVRERFAFLSDARAGTQAASAPGSAAAPAADAPTGSSMRRRVAAAGITTADTSMAAGVALASAAARRRAQGERGTLLPEAPESAIPISRLLRGPRFELSAYSDHVRPSSLPSTADFEDDDDSEDEAAAAGSAAHAAAAAAGGVGRLGPAAAAGASEGAAAGSVAPAVLAPLTRESIMQELARSPMREAESASESVAPSTAAVAAPVPVSSPTDFAEHTHVPEEQPAIQADDVDAMD